jgi:hypothetical protein
MGVPRTRLESMVDGTYLLMCVRVARSTRLRSKSSVDVTSSRTSISS